MPVPSHLTQSETVAQFAHLSDDCWNSQLAPRLPPELALKARQLKAFERVRGLACPADLLRALLAYLLDSLSFRALGAWAVLVGLADISDSAWRKRLKRANPWLEWLVSQLLAAAVTSAPQRCPLRRRVLLVDATRLRQQGGSGDDWRVHLAYDLTAARMAQLRVCDKRSAEKLSHFSFQAGDILVADNGYGYRSQLAEAQQQQADVLLRIALATFPFEHDDGRTFDAANWLLSHHGALVEWTGWCRSGKQRYRVRLIGSKLPADKAALLRKRKTRKAAKNGHRASSQSLQLAAWLVLVTTLETSWSASELLQLYRARWQIELVFKRLKQLLRVTDLRCRERAALEATVRLLVVAWALQEQIAKELRELLPNGIGEARRAVSSWLQASVSVQSLRAQVRGSWTLSRLRACLPRLVRFIVSSPRKRRQQEGEVRHWLEQRLSTAGVLEQLA